MKIKPMMQNLKQVKYVMPEIIRKVQIGPRHGIKTYENKGYLKISFYF